MTKRYSVRHAYTNRRGFIEDGPKPEGGRFARLEQARKEAARLNERSRWRVNTHADLLRDGSFASRYRVWDHWTREWV